MPDEVIITELENLFNQVVELGAEKERTRMVPNLLITNAAPAGLSDFVIVKDDRDGDNILATKVPGVIYATNDLVNVLFVRGGEAIAFQQGSQSGSSGIWEIVPGTSTDIVYAQGKVGIGKTVAPDATLEVLDTSQAQLRLTFQEDTKFATFTVDTNHDLTIKPSSTGQVILQATTDSTDFFQVLDADGGTPVLNADSTNERVGVGTASPAAKLEVIDTTIAQLRLTHTASTKFVDFTVDTNHDLTIKPSSTGQVKIQPTTDSTDFFQVLDADGGDPVLSVDSTNEYVGIGTSTPGYKLHVYTTAAASTFRVEGAGAFAGMQFKNGTPNLFFDFVDGADAIIGRFQHTGGILYIDNRDTNGDIVFQLDDGGGLSEKIRFLDDGSIGVGVSAPQGRIHTYLSISGFLLWEYDGLDGTDRTIIPNGAGDVLYRLTFDYIARDSGGNTASGSGFVAGAGNTTFTVGAETVRVRVNADGSVDTARTAGSNTIKVAYTLRWL